MKIIISALIITSFFLSFSANAQSSVSISTGVSTDLNNSKNSFYHIPISLQWKPSKKQKAPFFFEADYGIPFLHPGTGNAYTLNPAMPEEVILAKNICASIFTMAIGFRIHLYTNKKNNSFYLNLLPVGVCNQNFKVTYKNYDKANYEILNPDISTNTTGFVMSMATVYNFHKRKQDMMIMLHLQSPLLTSDSDYPLSYKFIAPLQLTFGYNFYYKK